ncbi:hypothetical protein F2Q68_00007593 [Brassica cretica]|uniref:Uncharacterized protein n=1 Tax=Brassica cretica TaxID=69181 RepID=A0A8S9KZ00_BRACR|nr:hypothetical protein F2Q68_00007593 [Brassica cretica]
MDVCTPSGMEEMRAWPEDSTSAKPNMKPVSNLQQDKQASVKSRAEGCCAMRTGKQPIQLSNPFTLLSVLPDEITDV